MQKVLTMQRLHSYIFTGSDSIDAFFKCLRDLQKECVKAGNTMDDSTFCKIVLAAFPNAEFDTIIQNITSSSNFPTSAAVIQQIVFQFTRVESRNNSVTSGDCVSQANTAVLAKIDDLERHLLDRQSRDTCDNCRRPGHLKAKCWRKGGGCEGQYPAWWKGKKDPIVSIPKCGS